MPSQVFWNCHYMHVHGLSTIRILYIWHISNIIYLTHFNCDIFASFQILYIWRISTVIYLAHFKCYIFDQFQIFCIWPISNIIELSCFICNVYALFQLFFWIKISKKLWWTYEPYVMIWTKKSVLEFKLFKSTTIYKVYSVITQSTHTHTHSQPCN